MLIQLKFKDKNYGRSFKYFEEIVSEDTADEKFQMYKEIIREGLEEKMRQWSIMEQRR